MGVKAFVYSFSPLFCTFFLLSGRHDDDEKCCLQTDLKSNKVHPFSYSYLYDIQEDNKQIQSLLPPADMPTQAIF